MHCILRICAAIMLIGCVSNSSKADYVINSVGGSVLETFAGFAGAGFSPTPAIGQLDSDSWAITGVTGGPLSFGGTTPDTRFARGASNLSGSVDTGGIYAFEPVSGNRAFGIQPDGDVFGSTGTITMRILNTTGTTLTNANLSYDLFAQNNAPGTSSFNFSYSDDGNTYNSVSSLNYTSIAGSDALTWVLNPRATALTGLNWNNNDFLFLQWTLTRLGETPRDEFALDNIRVFNVTAVPEPTSLLLVGLAGVGGAFVARRRRAVASRVLSS